MISYLGGRQSSRADRERFGTFEKLKASPVVATGWPHQCRCGEMVIVKYRGRFYCQRCGKRWRLCVAKVHGDPCPCNCPLPAAPAKGSYR